MITVEKALQSIFLNFRPLGLEKVNILDARARVIGEDVFATRNIPPANNSAMDGYAVRHVDTKGATRVNPLQLQVIEEIPAGKVPQKKLKKGEASRIMTGAIIPDAADAIVRQEDTKKIGKRIMIYTSVKEGQDIRFAGEDVQKEDLLISRGSIVSPAQIGMLASLGRTFVSMYQKPRVAIIATGDELVNIETDPPPAKIVNSNSYSLAAQVMECGAIPLILGIAKDQKSELQKKFKTALHADLIISSGGISVGDFDLVKDVMGEIGNVMHFWQVAMKPGKPLAFGTIKGIPLFGLPGNPVSAMVSFEQFVRPYLLKMQGHTKIFRQTIKALSSQEIQGKKGVKYFIRAIVKKEKNQYLAAITGEQGSGILKSMVLANALIVLKENETKVKKGDPVTVQLLDDSLSKTESFPL
ncbi:MAG: gephyrin-like molybdotransferase Glp [Smithellaceae bacterium]|jgi:molybdopterin molybdotransferase